MKTYLVTGGFSRYEYRSRAYDAYSKEEAMALARSEIDENYLEYLDWEMEDTKVMDDFQIIEVIEL
jgi:hypothetical protein